MVTRRVSEGPAATGLATSSSLKRRVPLGQLVIKAGQFLMPPSSTTHRWEHCWTGPETRMRDSRDANSNQAGPS